MDEFLCPLLIHRQVFLLNQIYIVIISNIDYIYDHIIKINDNHIVLLNGA